ncbi:hypothetical protein [Salegentibacter sp. UBA1130]|uniref:hypothetical protein n=1 Tax=Salegentibacter sp. UBA1130 TaxID=1947451 RepID=UPI00257AE911|nr:hypothetical protein [Salegentibacter sp. UBA1130]
MAKEEFDPSYFMNVEMIEELKKLGDDPDIEDFTNGVFNCFKTPILLRVMADVMEEDNKLVVDILAKEINYRMIQVMHEKNTTKEE